MGEGVTAWRIVGVARGSISYLASTLFAEALPVRTLKMLMIAYYIPDLLHFDVFRDLSQAR